MALEKFRQIILPGLKDDGQVTAIHHMATHDTRRFDQIVKVGVQLGRAAGEIQSGNAAAGEKREYGIDGFAAHHFCARGTRFDMAMDAREVAVTAEIHLQRINPAPGQWRAELANFLTKRLHNYSSQALCRLVCLQQIGLDELIKIAVEHSVGIADFDVGAMILD